MRLHEECTALIEALGRRFGIAGLALDSTGVCALAFDKRLTVYLSADADTHGLVMFAVLGEFPASARPDLLAAMLRGNYMWRVTAGATLALDPEKDVALLTQVLGVYGLTSERLEAQLNTFVNTAMAWVQRLQEPASIPPAAPLPNMMLRV